VNLGMSVMWYEDYCLGFSGIDFKTHLLHHDTKLEIAVFRLLFILCMVLAAVRNVVLSVY